MTHLIANLSKKGVSFSVLVQVKPGAVVLMLEMQSSSSTALTARANRWWWDARA